MGEVKHRTGYLETSIVGDMQNLVGQGPEQPDLTLN